MPNLKPPVTTVAAGRAYRDRIMAAVDPSLGFTPLMTAYLTDTIDPDELRRGKNEGVFTAAKLYPANATTNSSHGVSDVKHIHEVLDTMEDVGMPLLVHGEVTHKDVDIFDREAADFVMEAGDNVGATITPHHLRYNRNAIFEGGIRPHYYCLPIAKREKHRLALRKAATSGSHKFFLGTDTAPHAVGAKENACGCAGVFNAPYAMESYALTFEEEGALDKLENFASVNGPKFYGLPLNEGTMTLTKKDQQVPERFTLSETDIIPFHAGETLAWSVS